MSDTAQREQVIREHFAYIADKLDLVQEVVKTLEHLNADTFGAFPPCTERATISSFREENFFLSNFFIKEIKYAGMTWRSAEHAYQATKTSDQVEMLAIKMAPTAGKAKRMGAKCSIRHDWELVKVGIMRDIVRAKFSDPELAGLLLATGDAELVEGNSWNDFLWGCVLVNGEWEGRNMLGRILMEVRQELREARNVQK